MISYAGIGSRDISLGEKLEIGKLAGILSEMGYVLYSGNAPGSDQSFGYGSKGRNVIYLPWMGFEVESFDYRSKSLAYYDMGSSEAGLAAIGSSHRSRLSSGGLRCMARNYHQIYGYGEYPMVSFVVYCADDLSDGRVKGGTNQAVSIAKGLGIPVVNMRVSGWNMRLKELLSGLKNKQKLLNSFK